MSIRPHILILAAGQGKRMHSELPKVVHPVLYRPMIQYVLDLATEIGSESVSVIVGHGETEVRKACESFPGVNYFRQDKQLGTGHAVSMAREALIHQGGQVLVLSGDVILLTRSSIDRLLEAHASAGAAATVLTAVPKDPAAYGRIVRGAGGEFLAIREAGDCTSAESAIREVNSGVYCFEAVQLWDALAKVDSKNRQGEFYLTDVIEVLKKAGGVVQACVLADPIEMIGINDRFALADVEARIRDRINRQWMNRGVTLEDPAQVWIDSKSRLSADVRIESGCRIMASEIGPGSVIEAGSRLVGARLGERVHIKQGCYIEDATIGRASSVGPYAHLRPGVELGAEVRIGNFVELKKARIGDRSKASHLSYVGDAEIGKDVNLGCGFITCNFDGGPVKLKTVIEDGVFVGSDSQMVAPVRVGRGAYIASGSTVTRDVPPDALAISRTRQDNKEGYAPRLRRKRL